MNLKKKNKQINKNLNLKEEKKGKINFCAESLVIARDIQWSQLIGCKRLDSDYLFFLEFVNSTSI